MSSYVSPALRHIVIDRAESLCEYCLIHEEDTFLGCQIEHIISEKHGGQTIESNLALACVFCNRFKGTDIATLSPTTGRLCRLFNPRTDRWSEHFRLDGVPIQGLTEIGSATVSLLQFNIRPRLVEREALVATARFPSPAARFRTQII